MRFMVELRDYQQELLAQVLPELDNPSARIMMQLPTGGGKTRIAGEFLSDWLQGGRKAVWLTHRRELAAQTESMLSESGVPATANIRWEPSTSAPTIANGVVILMAQTVSRRTARADVWRQYDVNDLMVIDEAHHATASGWSRAIGQWPGPVLGMTATPWRLSEREGFDHLFKKLVCGPQVAELQADNWLCPVQVIAPPEEGQIRGGEIDATGDYSEAGIERANDDRPDILTAGALQFWQRHAGGRPTIIYAVSVKHAENMSAVFSKAGVPAGLILGDTPSDARSRRIFQFQRGALKVLVNVVVATEGFDLPDAACVILARPTMSLSLYLQMVGRGLRPKPSGGDCLVLDLAGNSQRHGLPEQERQWSLAPRGRRDETGSPLVARCPDCEGLSPAASHHCQYCGAPFGESCGRCGQWRAWEGWSLKDACQWPHEPVCDRCHYDAHIQEQLPVTEELRDLAEMQDIHSEVELSQNRDPFLKNFLEEEKRRIYGDVEKRKGGLRKLIEVRDIALGSADELYRQFEQYIVELPSAERPQSVPEKFQRYGEWTEGLRRELVSWRDELVQLEAQEIDGQRVLESARERLILLLEAEAKDSGLVTQPRVQKRRIIESGQESPDISISESGEWLNFSELHKWGRTLQLQENKGASVRPWRLQTPAGRDLSIRNWAVLLSEMCEWLIQEGLLTENHRPVDMSGRGSRYLVSTTPFHRDGRRFRNTKQLSNGLFLEAQMAAYSIAQRLEGLAEEFNQDPSQFRVWLQ